MADGTDGPDVGRKFQNRPASTYNPYGKAPKNETASAK